MKEKILNLREKGLSWRQIAKELNCSKTTVCYYLGANQKEKIKIRTQKYRNTNFVSRKIERFCSIRNRKNKPTKIQSSDFKKLMSNKIRLFFMEYKTKKQQKQTFTVQDVIDKFGENPKCYLTGIEIDLTKPRTYQFDHKIPRSRGGDNSIENLGICTAKANQAKRDMTPEEFIELCKTVLETKGYKIEK